MQLNYREYSEQGKPLIILHGLFGSLSNWGWHSKQLAESFRVIGVDLRNHGDSPHEDEMDYQLMAQDVRELLQQLNISECAIIGHSMGGKVAMQLALNYPQLVSRLVVADIAPAEYPQAADGHLKILEGMAALDLGSLTSRKDAEQRLAEFVESDVTRKFILTNLTRNKEGVYRWRLNMDAIEKNYENLRARLEWSAPFTKPVLFVKGALSNYIHSKHEKEILEIFPAASVKIIMEAGHWLHAERPQVFQKIVTDFLLLDDSAASEA